MNKYFIYLWVSIVLSACNQNSSDKTNGLYYTEKYPNGKLKIERRQMDNGRSIIKEYYPSGNLKFEGSLRNDKLDGIGKQYRNDGTIESEGTWITGRKNGFFKYYRLNGSLEKIIEYIPFRDTVADRPNQMFKIGMNGDTLLNGQSLFYEYWFVKDTIKMNKEEYQFKIVLKGHIFNNALLRVCDFDERFNLPSDGHCDEIPFDKGFTVITALTPNKYKVGKNTLRGEIINYDEFKTPDGKDTGKSISIYFSHDFYVIE